MFWGVSRLHSMPLQAASWESRMVGFQEGWLRNSWPAAFLVRKSCIARKFLLELDISLAVAEALQMSSVVSGAHCENEPLQNAFGVFKVILRSQGSSGFAARIFRDSVTMPRTAGEWGFRSVDPPKQENHTTK